MIRFEKTPKTGDIIRVDFPHRWGNDEKHYFRSKGKYTHSKWGKVITTSFIKVLNKKKQERKYEIVILRECDPVEFGKEQFIFDEVRNSVKRCYFF